MIAAGPEPELVIFATVLTLDEAQPTAEALAVAEQIADLQVRATFLAGRQVYCR